MIACVLPGMDHTEEDLAACEAQAAGMADDGLLRDAWEVRHCILWQLQLQLLASQGQGQSVGSCSACFHVSGDEGQKLLESHQMADLLSK